MSRNESLEKQRLIRIKNMNTILGEPDLLSILKVSIVNSFLSHKKTFEIQQKFIFGLNFPTTAHFSSYINDKINSIKKINKAQTHYKIKLLMYDIFHKVDFQIQINIPGSLEIRGYNLNGQPVNTANIDFQSVYYSSVLRSMYPYYYHQNMQIHGQIAKFQVLQSFIKGFIPFAMSNQIEYNEEIFQFENIGIELLINYLKQNCLWNLSQILVNQLSKVYPQRAYIFKLQLQYLQGQNKKIILSCAEQLLKQNCSSDFKCKLIQFQLKALCKLKKKAEAKSLGQFLIRQGLDNLETWQQILKLYFQQNDDRCFFKILNTATSFSGEQIPFRQKLQKSIYPKQLEFYRQHQQEKQYGHHSIIDFPEYMIRFDVNFMQNQPKFKKIIEILQKSQKQRPTAEMIHRLNISYNKQTFFQKFVSLFEKQKGWNKLVEMRAQCFWLENDYTNYQNQIKKKTSDMSYRFMNQSISDLQVSSHKNSSASSKRKQKEKQQIKDSKQQKQQKQDDQVPQGMNQSFQGQFSDSQGEQQGQMNVVAPCSKRVATKRVSRQLGIRKVQFSKILCNYNLEKMFLISYNNLKLHADIQKWSTRLDFKAINDLSKQKKQLIAYVFIKKGFFHKNMLRFRKSQQAFKIARKCYPQSAIGLISSYCLAKLYLQHNNIKGVEYYTVQIVRTLYQMGVEKYHAVPQWAKQIIPYIIKNYGKNISKRLEGPLKQLVQLWLQIDYRPVETNKKHNEIK